MDFNGKTVVITGGTQGLGKSVAVKLNKLGADLIIVGLQQKHYDGFKDELTGNHEFHAVDISDEKQIKTFVSKIANRKIDCLFNNAGIWTDYDIEASDVGRREKAINTNLLGTINFTEALLPKLLETPGAQIVFTNSTSGTVGLASSNNANWATYGATKWGLKGYILALKTRLQDEDIKIGAIYPGGFESELYESAGRSGDSQHNQPWMMRTETVTNAVVFMLSQPADANIDELVISKHSGQS